NIAAVNYHFGDKERLYAETVRHAGRHCLESVPMPEWAPGTPPEQKLHDFITMFLQRVAVDREPAWCPQLIMRELARPTAMCAEFVREFARPNFAMLASILRELLPDVPEVKRRLVGFSIAGQVLHYRFARPVVTLLVGPEEFKTYDVALLSEHI